ncbi:MAG: DNA methyltransferase [Victivallaceae bacterium]
MALFQNSVISKYLQSLDRQKINAAYARFDKFFHDPVRQENIRNSKEEQYQGEFLIDLFVNILGYTKNPTPQYNLTTEYKNVKDSRKADGAVIINDAVKAVIELKGTDTTDLSKIENQAFGYKNNQPDCTYVIIANFEKLRFYIDNAIEYIEFNLFTLTAAEFELLYLCLAYDNIRLGIPKQIKDESLSQEGAITKKLYNDYSLFKRELHQNLVALNPDHDPLELFKKSQKLLDRFLFLFFAEDRLLLPPNSVRLVLNDWRELQDRDVDIPLYDRFKKYFEYLNTGYKGKRYDVFAYNGGLFKPDAILDAVKIDSELLFRHTAKLSDYDFASEVDVNILGHIFENSLNELDEIKARLAGQAVDKTSTKRKKDGVFYTPKYITKYIVENTVGKLCLEKKAELQLNEDDYTGDKRKNKQARQALNDKLAAYRNWLLRLTICDPACGSGAFLNQALDFLINEHQYIDELHAKLFGDTMILSDVDKSILENNLFGVDLNEESVEIAKLSLWLRTARPNRKLNDLNNNIKCGNSLIDDPAVAGEKAFNWQKEFPQVFEKGGFDVVIGNPPYVRQELLGETQKTALKKSFSTFSGATDLYVYFVEQGFKLLKSGGFFAYIMPNKWLQAGYGQPLREFILNKHLIQIVDFGDLQIFNGATTYPCILTARNAAPQGRFTASTIKALGTEQDFNYIVQQIAETFETCTLGSDAWVISSGKEQNLLARLKRECKKLADVINGEAYYGIKTGFTEAFLISAETRDRIIAEDNRAAEVIKPFLQGRDVTPYTAAQTANCLLLFEKGYTKNALSTACTETEGWQWLENAFPSIAAWLTPYEEKAKKRTDKGDFWWELRACDYYAEFRKPKIMYQKFQVKPCFVYDETGLYCNDSMWIIPTDDRALIGILNSKMGWWLITKYCTQIQNGFQLIWRYFGQIPIPAADDSGLAVLADKMLSLNKELQEVTQRFQRTLQRKFELAELPGKLQDWYLLSYAGFIRELGKKKIKLTLAQEAEWEEYFVQESQKAQELKAAIDTTDRTIDQMVYELYGLTEAEIKIVERM